MKNFIFVILFWASVSSLHSQTLFPLNVGDKWRYWEYPTYFRIVENLENTVLSNNKMYYHFSSGAHYRQQGDSVFIFDFSLNDEYLIFDFSAEVGDTITNIQYPYSDTLRIILANKYVGEYWGRHLETWTFFIDEIGFIDDEAAFSIADSLGIVEIWSTWVDERISGALINGVTYGNITDVKNEYELPTKYSLEQNYPNPFNPVTTIKYSIPRQANVGASRDLPVQLKIYDVLGNEIATLVNEQKSPGTYEVSFDGINLSSGIYFYILRAGHYSETKKFVLIK
ncbi:MAG: T9SS type A sorting domain-containing protein [Ignavibacteriae bacterium]|nr:T9SS C-terminal target domain-containing protein [Ignavibacteriota bacterium]NOG97884.1 T9SS type A sorting domain-containing protein [Ignavibacteriota bacterium]